MDDILAGKSVRERDEILYQETRRLVIAELQNIVYSEYLPLVLGRATAAKGGLFERVHVIWRSLAVLCARWHEGEPSAQDESRSFDEWLMCHLEQHGVSLKKGAVKRTDPDLYASMRTQYAERARQGQAQLDEQARKVQEEKNREQ